MTKTIFGKKRAMTECYLGNTCVPVTKVEVYKMTISQLKTVAKDGYDSVQVAFGNSRSSKALAGHLKKSGLKSGTLREIQVEETQTVGDVLEVTQVLTPGSLCLVQGTSKGKGFQGVVKRWGFAGGFKTHGQSDRHRAPGSIGQGTTPGRVHRGKKMPGHMGVDTQTVKNALVVAVQDNFVWLSGPVPGNQGGLLRIEVTGSRDIPEVNFIKGYQKL